MFKLASRLVGCAAFALIFFAGAVMVLLISTETIRLRELFPNLPETPQFGQAGAARPDFSVPDFAVPDVQLPEPEGVELPEIGGLPELPGIEVPGDLLEGGPVVLAETVERRELTSRVPAPQQVSTAPPVIGTNAFYAILMALVFGVTSTILGNMLRDEEPRIRAWLRAAGIEGLLAKIGSVFSWTFGRAVRRGCLTLPLFFVIFGLYGIIFAFLEEGTALLTTEGALLAVLMAFTVGLVSLTGDIARRIAGRIWHTDSHFSLYPVNLGIAAFTVAISRLFHLSPGIAFGTPGGADVDLPPGQGERREGILSLLETALLIAVGAVGWAASGFVFSALDMPVDGRLAARLGGLLSVVQDAGLAVFFVALETAFFELLPLAYGSGQSLYRWQKGVWVLLFVPVAFMFNHTLLNPQSGFLDSFMVSNVRFLWVMLFVLVGLTAGLWFYFNVIDDVLQEWVGIKRHRTPRPAPADWPAGPPVDASDEWPEEWPPDWPDELSRRPPSPH